MTNRLVLTTTRQIICYFLLPLTLHAQTGTPEITPQQLVSLMYQATHELNYDGILIYRHGSQMDTMRLIHKQSAEGEIERLVSLSGHAREVIRNRHKVTCYFPDQQAVMVEKSRPYEYPVTRLTVPVETTDRYYRFTITGHDRVAGQNAIVVTIQPNDNYRYGYQFWINEENHLLLKSELKNESGYPLEQIVFTKLEVLKSIPDELLMPAASSQSYTSYDNTALDNETAATGDWQSKWLPDGFILKTSSTRELDGHGSELNHLVYTDGMAIVTIFIEKIRNRTQVITGTSRIGAVNAYSRQANGHQITAVGEVPLATVEKMAISVVKDQ